MIAWQEAVSLGMRIATAVLTMAAKIDVGDEPIIEQSFKVKGYTVKVSVSKKATPPTAIKLAKAKQAKAKR